jgi:hypothetical protein
MSVVTHIFISWLLPMFGAHGIKLLFFGAFCPLYYIFLNLRTLPIFEAHGKNLNSFPGLMHILVANDSHINVI